MSTTPTAALLRDKHDALTIRNLRFRHDRAIDAPQGRDWTIDVPTLALGRGEQMLLTGGSGSGKSTLLHLIAGLIDPQHGTVHVAGTDVHTLEGARRDRFRGRHVGMIFQTFHLLPGFSALENVMLAPLFAGESAVEQRRRGSELLERLEIATPDRDVATLSVGQQQRVAVARAIACEPVIILADEPTASLDPPTAATAMNLIQQVCRERNAALLCTSHDPAMAERFARRSSLDELRGAAATRGPQAESATESAAESVPDRSGEGEKR